MFFEECSEILYGIHYSYTEYESSFIHFKDLTDFKVNGPWLVHNTPVIFTRPFEKGNHQERMSHVKNTTT